MKHFTCIHSRGSRVLHSPTLRCHGVGDQSAKHTAGDGAWEGLSFILALAGSGSLWS